MAGPLYQSTKTESLEKMNLPRWLPARKRIQPQVCTQNAGARWRLKCFEESEEDDPPVTTLGKRPGKSVLLSPKKKIRPCVSPERRPAPSNSQQAKPKVSGKWLQGTQSCTESDPFLLVVTGKHYSQHIVAPLRPSR